MVNPVPLRVVPSGKPEVNAKVVAKLRQLLKDAEAGQIIAIEGAALDPTGQGHPYFEGEAPCVVMHSLAVTLAALTGEWAKQIVIDDGDRYLDADEE